MLLSLCLYNLIASFVNEIDKMHQNNITQDRLEKIEKYVKFLKKSVTIRDNCETMWSEEINTVRNENCNKMQELEKELSMYKEKVDEQTNIINEHQTNEQKIFQKISQVNKELRKLKKEMEQYQ
jgi:DNA repair exonuclease SbcCD ATPase subunit